jgi:3'(2'), 5'-bisphosphate nucleotidase
MSPPIPGSELLPRVVALAEKAGAEILGVYRAPETWEVQAKADQSPLTQADLAAHRVLTEGLGVLTPHWPVLSEESAEVPYGQRQRWQRFWMVDPLDGTKEFLQRNDEFTVNVALIEQGEPLLGVVLLPAQGLTYAAARGAGAFRIAAGGQPEPIRTQPYRGGPLRVVVSRSHAGAETEQFLGRLRARYGELETLAFGSALKLCRIAEGSAHLYPRLGPTMEWDVAAAQCVLEQAGGVVGDLQGRRLHYNKPDLHNPWFVAASDSKLLLDHERES